MPIKHVQVEKMIPLLEEILGEWKSVIGEDYQGYKNHVYRMLNFCFYLHNPSEEERKKLVIAAAFHDIGIWSEGTIDYLPPSIEQATLYLERNQLSDWCDEVVAIIDFHHKLRAVNNEHFPLIEVFRRADLADFSLGFIRAGIPSSYVNSVRSEIPNAGFHKCLMRLTWKQLKQNPLNPAPMMKW